MSDQDPEAPKPKQATTRRKAATSPSASTKASAGSASTKASAGSVSTKASTSDAAESAQPTEVLEPIAPSPAGSAAEPDVEVVATAKRRRWPFVVGGVAVLVVILLVVGYLVGENYARSQAVDTIRQRIVAVLGVNDPATVTVDLGDGSVLLQALAGTLNQVDVTADSVTFGELTGAATLHAERVPLNETAATESLDITFRIPEEVVAVQIADSLGGIQVESVVLAEPEIVVSTSINLLFFELPISLGLQPSAADGQLVFTPTAITLGDQAYTPAELRAEFGDFADPFLADQTICVSESLPSALSVTDLAVAGTELVLTIDGDNVALGGAGMTTMGTCQR